MEKMVMISESHNVFLKSLSEYIKDEKERLECPEEGPDDQRYNIYSYVFDKVIQRSTAYMRLLSAIKREYDDVILRARRRDEDIKRSQRRLRELVSHPASIQLCQRQASQLKERLAVIQKETADMEEVLEEVLQESRVVRSSSSSEHQSLPDPTSLLLNLRPEESEEALERHLQSLEAEWDVLLTRRRHRYVPLEVKVQLETRLQEAELQKEELMLENSRLYLQYKRLRCLKECLEVWEEKQDAPLKEFLSSTQESLLRVKVSNADYQEPGCVAFVDDDPGKIQETEVLVDYLDRLEELIEAGEYRSAALHAAGAPRGALTSQTMDLLKAVEERSESPAALLLFMEALLSTDAQEQVHPAERLSAERLSVEVVCWALERGATELVMHAVTQRKLMFSELLGDVLSKHAQKQPAMADMCLTLACDVYQCCHVHRKAALSMCKRGMVHTALGYMHSSDCFTAEDCVWVVRGAPSLSLLQMLTEPFQSQMAMLSEGQVAMLSVGQTAMLSESQAAMLSVGQACSLLLDPPEQGELVLQLLDSLLSRGAGVLERAVLEDNWCSLDGWVALASFCSRRGHGGLDQQIRSILLSQSGSFQLTPDTQGARLMEHVFL